MTNLAAMKNANLGMHYVANVNSLNNLRSVCFSLPMWREDYRRFGILPGISIDGKDISNRYELPMFAINGRTNNGKVYINTVAFLANQTGDEIAWCLKRFKECHLIPPNTVTLDQDMAGINAVMVVFPQPTYSMSSTST